MRILLGGAEGEQAHDLRLAAREDGAVRGATPTSQVIGRISLPHGCPAALDRDVADELLVDCFGAGSDECG